MTRPTARGRTRLARAGVKLDQTKALIVLRRGNAIDQAKVLEKDFTIETEELGTLHVPTRLIKSVILKNGVLFPLDVIRLLKGNEISGTVTTDPVRVVSDEAGGRIDISLPRILAIVF